MSRCCPSLMHPDTEEQYRTGRQLTEMSNGRLFLTPPLLFRPGPGEVVKKFLTSSQILRSRTRRQTQTPREYLRTHGRVLICAQARMLEIPRGCVWLFSANNFPAFFPLVSAPACPGAWLGVGGSIYQAIRKLHRLRKPLPARPACGLGFPACVVGADACELVRQFTRQSARHRIPLPVLPSAGLVLCSALARPIRVQSSGPALPLSGAAS